MHNSIENHAMSVDLWSRHLWKTAALVLLASIPALYLLIIGRTLPAVAYVAIPFVVFLIASPKYSYCLFIALNFFYAPHYVSGFAVHPWDLAAFIFLAAVVISWLFKYSAVVDKTAFDYNMIALILATVLSAVFAHKASLSVIPTARIILLFAVFRAIYYLGGKIGPSRMLRYFILVFTLFSLNNSLEFFMGGGAFRIFGYSGIAFETFCMIGVPSSLAYAIWSQRKSSRVFYTFVFLINLGAAIATMSRGPLLTIAIAVPVLLYVSHRKARQSGFDYARNYVRSFVTALIPVLLLMVIGSGYFLFVGERFEELVADQPTGTILLRLSLWKAAIDGFLLDPLTGIGIGNFRVIDALVPNLKFDAVRYYLVGMSFHNVFLQYLCETGLPGALAILFLGWNVYRTGKRTLNAVVSKADMPMVSALYISGFIFFITIFYMRAWTWGQEGYVLALVMGLLARAYRPVQLSGRR